MYMYICLYVNKSKTDCKQMRIKEINQHEAGINKDIYFVTDPGFVLTSRVELNGVTQYRIATIDMNINNVTFKLKF